MSPSGLDSNKGAKSKLFKTPSAAAEIAQPGDVITVHEGVYRERVDQPRGGASNDKRIVYLAGAKGYWGYAFQKHHQRRLPDRSRVDGR